MALSCRMLTSRWSGSIGPSMRWRSRCRTFRSGSRRSTGAGEQLITNGPLVDFYGRPHPQINRFQYWELRVIWLMLRGECFRVPIFEDGALGERALPGRLKSVLILDPARFQHIVEDNRADGLALHGLQPQQPALQPGVSAGGSVAREAAQSV